MPQVLISINLLVQQIGIDILLSDKYVFPKILPLSIKIGNYFCSISTKWASRGLIIK